MTATYDEANPAGVPKDLVRLLLNDVAAPWVFTDVELEALLALEGDSVKMAAAQAIDTNATNLVLASRVLKTQDLTTDGAKVADAMRAHAKSLRDQALEYDDEGSFDIIPMDPTRNPDSTSYLPSYLGGY